MLVNVCIRWLANSSGAAPSYSSIGRHLRYGGDLVYAWHIVVFTIHLEFTVNKVAVVLVVVAEEEGDEGAVKFKKNKQNHQHFHFHKAQKGSAQLGPTLAMSRSVHHTVCVLHILHWSILTEVCDSKRGYCNFQQASHASLRKEHLDGK